jgi:uncharacterized protein (DUF1810 family)
MDDPYDLQRFVDAQAGQYADALAELRAGHKRSHWIWFVFPQIAGLGRSPTAQHFAISSLDEAKAYLLHPLLGPRLREAIAALDASGVTDAERVFGALDAMKVRSSLTLFTEADPHEEAFTTALERWFGGSRDAATLRLLGGP